MSRFNRVLLELVPTLMMLILVGCIYYMNGETRQLAVNFDKHHEACFNALNTVQKQVSRLQDRKDREGSREIAQIIESIDHKRELKKMNDRIDFIHNKTAEWQRIILDYLSRPKSSVPEEREVSVF